MSPEVLENIEGLTGGYGSPGAGSLTPEEAERLNLGGDVGSQAVKNALARLGKPYSQAKRDRQGIPKPVEGNSDSGDRGRGRDRMSGAGSEISV